MLRLHKFDLSSRTKMAELPEIEVVCSDLSGHSKTFWMIQIMFSLCTDTYGKGVNGKSNKEEQIYCVLSEKTIFAFCLNCVSYAA